MVYYNRPNFAFSFPLIFSYLVRIVYGIIAFLIGLRFIFLLLGANRSQGFVAWIMANSYPLVAPFQGIFPTPVLSTGFIIDIASLIALLVYGFIAYLIDAAVNFLAFGE